MKIKTMNRSISLFLVLATMISVFAIFFAVPVSAASDKTTPSIQYSMHVQNVGWQPYRANGSVGGTEGLSLRGEAIKIKISGMSGGIKYKTHIQNIGWTNYSFNNAICGTVGKSLRMEAIAIELTGEIAKYYDVEYCAHVENIGWMEWVKNGKIAGTEGKSLRLEAVRIRLVAKSTAADQWQMPMKGNVITTQTFGSSGHLGIDIKSTTDSSVYAVADGKVVATGLNGTGNDASTISNPKGNGYYVVIEHTIGGKRVYSMYGHLKYDSIKVEPGQNILKGTEIGICGNTGYSKGVHLHFAIADTYRAGSYYGYTSSRQSFNRNSMCESRTGITFFNPVYVINNEKLP